MPAQSGRDTTHECPPIPPGREGRRNRKAAAAIGVGGKDAHRLNRHPRPFCAPGSLNDVDRPLGGRGSGGQKGGQSGEQHGTPEVAAHGHANRPRAPTQP